MLTRPYNSVPQGELITFNATITDNGGISSVTFSLLGESDQSWDMVRGEDNRYEFTHIFVSTGTYNFVISAVDDSGNEHSLSGSVNLV